MRFVSVSNMVSWVRETGPEKIIAGMVDAMEVDFRRWERFEREPRVASHSPIGVIELMPTSDGELYAFKYVNGHPANPSRGFQTVTAFGVLADVMTGYPLFLSEMTLLTALRTAAASGLAARWLARPDARVHAMIGAGSQAEFQALAIRSQLGITDLRLFDTDRAAADATARNLRPLGFEVTVADSAAAAAADADLITTCTADKANAVVLRADEVRPGAHINAIGGDCPGKTELDLALVRENRLFVEHTPQTRIEGELQQLPADWPATEVWSVIAGLAPGRVSSDEITVFDSVGFAIEDFTALRYTRDATANTRYSESIDLIAEPEDPKDLFGMVGAPVPVV
ncbi:ornithine cyclodeaminase [Microbacterium oleivorans]|uniref:Ornithine cyclodeaminase n=1 Tax=Microbacterium oleivorans TaxID=273677 RepID=A0A7D5IUH6_9MICO|nr:ornithine cyclodeaminase [Microbacterium oleivorans]QLD13077.1 ornithine cyclodeaminase [Microbacterium oleivorans]